jgi:aminoglycoside N3'-acetyltransferase
MNVNAHQDLIGLSKSTWEWMSARDTGPLEALFDEQAVFVHMGATFTKEQELDVIRTGRIHYRDVDVEDVSVRIIGSTAIVLTTLELTAVVDANEVTNPFVVTEAYARIGDAWKLASMSFTRLVNR